MKQSLAKRDSISVKDHQDLIKAIAMDIGKEVAHHIEIMYPGAVKAVASTFLLSVRNTTYNQIMAALEVSDENKVIARLAFREKFRRHIRAAYKNIRRDQ